MGKCSLPVGFCLLYTAAFTSDGLVD